MPRKKSDKALKRDTRELAVILGMEVYGWLHDRYYDAKRAREHCKCSSPEHTSLVAAIDQCVGIMSNWVFMASGHDYTLLEKREEEAESIVPEFAKLGDKWVKGELE